MWWAVPWGGAADLGPSFRPLVSCFIDEEQEVQKVPHCAKVPDGVNQGAKDARPVPGSDNRDEYQLPAPTVGGPRRSTGTESFWKQDEVGGALSMCLALEEPRVGKVPSGRF